MEHSEKRELVALEQFRHPTKFRIARTVRRPIKLRKVQRPGWTAELPIYVRWCEPCQTYSVSHPAGYGRIHCDGCNHRYRVMTWQRFRDKYAGMIVLLLVAVVLYRVWLMWSRAHGHH